MMHQHVTLNCKGRILDLSTPVVMGILNVTDDSFYDGGRYFNEDKALVRAIQIKEQGAAIIDVGGMSSRPGAKLISHEEEMNRVLPVIAGINKRLPDIIISIDTFRASVAEKAVQAGASIINDISAGTFDDSMFGTVAKLKVPYVIMHIKGTPSNMQDNPVYEDVTLEILDFFIAKIGELRSLDLTDIVIDPGFGFGKTIDHNYKLLNNLHVFKMTGLPILAGISRKSMIYIFLESTPEDSLIGTSALHMVALQQGARILRAHDVKEAVEVIALFTKLQATA